MGLKYKGKKNGTEVSTDCETDIKSNTATGQIIFASIAMKKWVKATFEGKNNSPNYLR